MPEPTPRRRAQAFFAPTAAAVTLMTGALLLASPLTVVAQDASPAKSGLTVQEKTPVTRPGKTGAAAKARPAKPAFKPVSRSFLMVASDAPTLNDKTVAVITEDNEFGTIQVGIATRIVRGETPVELAKIRHGDRLRVQGYWDVDGFRFHASTISVGARVAERALDRMVAEACKRVGRSRISGGFGVASSAAAAVPPPGGALPPDATGKPGEAKPGEEKPVTPPTTPPVVPPPTVPPPAGT